MAGQQAPLPIIGETVGHLAGPAEHLDAVFLVPAADDIPGHVREQQELLAWVPEGTLGEQKAGGHLHHLGFCVNDPLHAGIADDNAHPVFPAPLSSTERSPTYDT